VVFLHCILMQGTVPLPSCTRSLARQDVQGVVVKDTVYIKVLLLRVGDIGVSGRCNRVLSCRSGFDLFVATHFIGIPVSSSALSV